MLEPSFVILLQTVDGLSSIDLWQSPNNGVSRITTALQGRYPTRSIASYNVDSTSQRSVAAVLTNLTTHIHAVVV